MNAVEHPASRALETLEVYDHLLVSYVDELNKAPVNPYESAPALAARLLRWSFLKFNVQLNLRVLVIPNVLKIDFIGADSILGKLEAFDDQTLRAVSECNRINRSRMIRRSVLGVLPQIAAGSVAALGIAKTISGSLGLDGIAARFRTIWMILTVLTLLLFGFALLNYLMSIQSVRLLTALDDLIAITQANRDTGHKT